MGHPDGKCATASFRDFASENLVCVQREVLLALVVIMIMEDALTALLLQHLLWLLLSER